MKRLDELPVDCICGQYHSGPCGDDIRAQREAASAERAHRQGVCDRRTCRQCAQVDG